jgi:hypothetical protein
MTTRDADRGDDCAGVVFVPALVGAELGAPTMIPPAWTS